MISPASKGVATCKNMSKFASKFTLIIYLHVDFIVNTNSNKNLNCLFSDIVSPQTAALAKRVLPYKRFLQK